MFSQPIRLVPPPSWLSHVPFAFWLTEAVRPAVFVELGTHSGNSYAAFAQAVQSLGLGTACYAVDTWKGDKQAGFYDESVFDEWSAFHARHFGGFSRLVRSTFDEAREAFADRSVDLLHIDGLHTYDAIRHDFESWLPKLSTRAVVVLHDINVREGDFGAWRFWDEVRSRYLSFSFLHGHGLGVVAVGTDVAPEVRWLVSEIDGQERTLVQQFFSTLGRSVEEQLALSSAEGAFRTERQEWAARVHQLDASAHERAARIDELSRALEELRRTDQRHLHETQDALSAELARLQQALASATAECTARASDALVSRAESERLREGLVALDHERAAAESEGTELRIAVATLVREKTAAQTALASVNRELDRIRASRSWRVTAPLRGIGSIGLGPLLRVRTPRAAVAIGRTVLRPQRLIEIRRVTRSPLFDERYYLTRYDDVRRSGVPAQIHYAIAGAREGRSPHALFDGAFYLARNRDVRERGANPLIHYVLQGAREHRDPHPLFLTQHYASQIPELAALGVNPLVHFLAGRGDEGPSPHPLFDAGYYLEQNPDLAASKGNLLVHFLERGARESRAPHPLFDVSFYLRRNPDVREAGINPLLHYLERVPGEDRDPHPLFDSSYYLSHSPDLAAQGVNPLVHFLQHGWREGRKPNPGFDPQWYLEVNPDVAASGQNPLEHFVRFGWREGRDPSPEFDSASYVSRYPDVASQNQPALIHFLAHGQGEGRATTPATEVRRLGTPPPVTLHVHGRSRGQSSARAGTIICLSHVVPWPPRAGNEYRIHRLLRWLRSAGFRVVLVTSPLPGETVDAARLQALADAFGNVVHCHRDGRVEYLFDDCGDLLSCIDGTRTRNFASLLGEPRQVSGVERRLLIVDRTYCHDVAMEVTLRLQEALKPSVLLAQYVWMSRVLPLVDPDVLRVIDSHDVMSDKRDKVIVMGIDDLEVTPGQEARRLRRADLVLAIQEDEARMLRGIVPDTPVITVGVDFDTMRAVSPPDAPVVFTVGSGNPGNRAGLLDFLRFAWPRILACVPEARLVVAGGVGAALGDGVRNVEVVGVVDDLAPYYKDARVIVNPTVAGTGLKIKTVEALSHFRPVVTWPSGLDGIPLPIRALMPAAEDWFEFANRVVSHLRATGPAFDESAGTLIREFLSPEFAYGEFCSRLREFVDSTGVSGGPAHRDINS